MTDKMNYRIIENPPPHYEEKYDEFVELYNNPDMSIIDIRSQLGWTVKTYSKARLKALGEGKIVERRIKRKQGRPRKPKHIPKNYYYRCNTNNYVVTKRRTIDGTVRTLYFGTYDTEEECKLLVEELKKVDWDKNELENIKKKLGII